MHTYDQVPLILPKMQHQKSLKLHWRSFSSWGKERFPLSFHDKRSQYCVYDYEQSVAPQITQNTPLTILDALLMLLYKMW